MADSTSPLKKTVTVLALVGGLLALVSLLRSCGSEVRHQAMADLDYRESLAWTFGQVIGDSIPGDGEVLVIQMPFIDDLDRKGADRELKALEKGLGGGSSTVLRVTPDLPAAERGGTTMHLYSGRWAETFLKWTAGHPDARAVVSFAGLPLDLSPEQRKELPPLLALHAEQGPDAAVWVERGLAYALAELRKDISPGSIPPSGKSPKELFQSRFILHR